MNKKGFTLIEVLAMLVVLGILMAVSIPNITGIVNQHKNNVIKSDVNKMVDATKIKMATDEDVSKHKPEVGDCIVLSLKYLNYNEDIGSGPHEGKYLNYESFVVVKRETHEYKYYVRLIEKNKDEYYGIKGKDYADIDPDESDYIEDLKQSDLLGTEKEDGTLDNYDASTINQIIKNAGEETQCNVVILNK